jgi:tungstate transport system substrate-binding protein
MRILTIVMVIASALSLQAQRVGPLLAPDPVELLRIAVVNTPDVLLNDLLPEFSEQTGITVTVESTEGVFDLAREGKADLVIAHYGHAGTEAFMADGLGRWPRMVFSNQAVLVGPASDPAGIRGLTDAAEAFRRIAQRGGEFLVNNAPTERYLAEVLWQASGAPPKQGWHMNLGLRDQAAIEMASQRRAYTLWGLVPFVRLQAQRQLGMEPLVVGDALFQRVMVSIVVNPARFPRANVEAALALERFLLEPRTQARMRQFRHHGLAGQSWWPAGRNNAGAELMQF